MTIEVASSDDIAALYATYIELVNGGREATLDIAFAPGVYGVASVGPVQLDLGGNPVPKEPKVDIVLRGGVAGSPAVFRDMGMLVNARSLHLENLIITGRNQRLLDARVTRKLVMKNCVIANNNWGGPWGGTLLRVTGMYDQPAYTVEIDDTWFVRNGAQSEAALLAVSPATGSFVDQVTLRRVTFLDNTTHSDLLVREARTIHAEDVLVVKNHSRPAVFLRYERAGRVTVERSTFVVDDPAAIAFEDTRTWSSGMELTQSKIYVTGTSRTPPRGVRGYPEILDGSQLNPRRDSIDEMIAAIGSGIPDPPTTRARLRDALGLVVH
jgi:hypothetical protein